VYRICTESRVLDTGVQDASVKDTGVLQYGLVGAFLGVYSTIQVIAVGEDMYIL
jgi:hypothetical protein